MKSKLFIMVAISAIAFNVNAQTKGTNALSFGLNFGKQETKQNNLNGSTSESKNKSSSVALGYGFFFEDNKKIALNLIYGTNASGSANGYEQNNKEYGVNANYQKYYPLIKKLYAYAGGSVGYTYGEQGNDSNANSNYSSNQYSVGAYGGVSLFLSKHFALETTLLSASMYYYNSKQTYDSAPNFKQESVNSYFSLNSQGVFNDLGFKIYLLF